VYSRAYPWVSRAAQATSPRLPPAFPKKKISWRLYRAIKVLTIYWYDLFNKYIAISFFKWQFFFITNTLFWTEENLMQSVFYKTTPLIRSPGSHRQIFVGLFVAGLTKEGWGQGDQTSPFPDPLIPVPAPFFVPSSLPFFDYMYFFCLSSL